MRKYVIHCLIIAVMFGLLSACSSSNEVKKETEQEEETNDQVNEEVYHEEEKEAEEGVEEQEEVIEEETIEARYRIDDVWQVVPIGDANAQVALITIDDAPDQYAVEMAHTLKDLDAPAIFFVNGMFLETDEQKEKLQEIHELGFEIGNHTYSHSDLSTLSEEEQYEEIVRVNDMVEEVIGERPTFFRAPFGVNTDYVRELTEEEGMVLMNWTYGYDWETEYQTKEALTDIMVHADELRGGANLLMHDREWTAAALADIITGLRTEGYELVDPKEIEQTN